MHLEKLHTIRTNNFNDEHVMQKISNMWKEASHSLSAYNGIVYGLYHDYASDYKGDYSLSVAIEQEERLCLSIPDDAVYEVFSVAPNDEQGIFHTWQEIWEKEEKGTLHRAYTYDFEVYKPNGEKEIHIAMKQD